MNSPVALPRGYLGILKLAINHIPHGRIIGDSRSCKGPVPSELSERYDLDSGCLVEPTPLLHLVVVLAADTWPTTILLNSYTGDAIKCFGEKEMCLNWRATWFCHST